MTNALVFLPCTRKTDCSICCTLNRERFGSFGRACQSCRSEHTCTGDGGAMTSRASIPMQDLEFVQFLLTGIILAAGLPKVAVAKLVSYEQRGRTSTARYAPMANDLASCDVGSRATQWRLGSTPEGAFNQSGGNLAERTPQASVPASP